MPEQDDDLPDTPEFQAMVAEFMRSGMHRDEAEAAASIELGLTPTGDVVQEPKDPSA